MRASTHCGASRAVCGAPSPRLLGRPVAPRACIVTRASGNDGEEGSGGRKLKGFFQDLFNFESWAPRSSRAWRLNQYDYESSVKSDDESDAISDLQERVARQQESSGGAMMSIDADSSQVDMPLQQRSFEDMGDGELASALSSRIQQLTADPGSSVDEVDAALAAGADEQEPLTGAELRQLVFTKYGKNHDMSLVRRDIPGKTFVCLNVMWSFLEQRSFKMTADQYMEKLDSIAYLLNVVGQADAIRAQLSGPPKSQNGMPARPVVGTAISLKLQVSEATVREWFGRGYQ